ncbi:MAG TPA: GDP-mannose 4,6-dehydratase [Solirubrobacteraceae bacterium]|jgi:UDP-glucose 4-epimerase|nr:GDP-mannose 4,6-dehydratase [Solirubrobacteraceae bacterium]
MRFLITGGAGFIGSHLADALLAEGHRVHVLDDLSTGSIDNVRHLKDDPRFGYTIDTCASTSVVAELVDEADVVYHLAAAVGVDLIIESPVRTIETNVHCTEVVLAQASKKKKPVLVASTSEVFGKSTTFPFREDGDIVLGATSTGRWSYACSKAIDEFLALAYWKERKLPTVVARLFNTVGPRQTGRYGMVVPTFVQQALAGRPITVYGDGTQTRCFCHVADVVRALIDLMLAGDAAHGEVFNIGSQEEISMLALADRVREMTTSDSEIQVIPYDEAYEEGFEDMPRRYPDTSKIAAAIGWEPTRSLDEILSDVISFHQSEAAIV